MMARKRKSHAAAFQAQAALAARKGNKTVNVLASQQALHPTLIHAWKKQFWLAPRTSSATAARTYSWPSQAEVEPVGQNSTLAAECHTSVPQKSTTLAPWGTGEQGTVPASSGPPDRNF
jgi:transposase